LGIAIGASIIANSDYPPYGWGAWGMSWNSRTVVVRGAAWVVPPAARYPYERPVRTAGGVYRPRPTLYAPTNINVNVRAPAKTGRVVPPRAVPYSGIAQAVRATPLPAASASAASAANPPPGQGARSATPRSATSRSAAPAGNGIADYGARGYNAGASKNAPAAERAQTRSSAFSGYQSSGAERAASTRGRISMSGSAGRKPSATL
jgi:hypothetical protein